MAVALEVAVLAAGAHLWELTRAPISLTTQQIVGELGVRAFGVLLPSFLVHYTKGDPYDGAGLVDAIRRTMAGEAFYGAMVAQQIREYHQRRRPEDQPPEALTRREIEVLDLLIDRKSNQEIAEQLVISVKTVKTHVANILAKLHLESRHEIPVYVRLRARARSAS